MSQAGFAEALSVVIAQVAPDLGLPAEALRLHVRRVEVDAGRRQGLTSDEREEIRKLRRPTYVPRRESMAGRERGRRHLWRVARGPPGGVGTGP